MNPLKAARDGSIDDLKVCIENGASAFYQVDANTIANRNRDLMNAAYSGNLDNLKDRISYGADVNYSDSTGFTPLMYAAMNGYPLVVDYLVGVGRCNMEAITGDGKNALMLAAWRGELETTRMLLSYGCNFEARDYVGKTPLHLAVEKGQLEVAKLLVNSGSNPLDKTNQGKTAYDLAAVENKWDSEEKQLLRKRLLEFLKEQSVTPDHIVADTNVIQEAVQRVKDV